jgi:DNA replication factor GINS
MDLDQLQSVRDRERQTDRLQQLRESFYEDAAEFVADLRAERQDAAAEADDPFDSSRVTRLTDRIRTAEQTLEAIYEKRVGKVVKAATFAAADLPTEAEGMTKEEAELFDTLVAEIEANRAEVLGRLSADHDRADGPSSAASPADSPASPADSPAPLDPDPDGDAAESGPDDGAVDAAEVMGGESPEPPPPPDEPAPPDAPPEEADGGEGPPGEDTEHEGARDSPTDAGESSPEAPAAEASGATDAAAPDVERALVRITDDVGPILGVDDREYDLAADDVVTLPAENAEPLVERGAAERLE